MYSFSTPSLPLLLLAHVVLVALVVALLALLMLVLAVLALVLLSILVLLVTTCARARFSEALSCLCHVRVGKLAMSRTVIRNDSLGLQQLIVVVRIRLVAPDQHLW